jgi:hypothetical protein
MSYHPHVEVFGQSGEVLVQGRVVGVGGGFIVVLAPGATAHMSQQMYAFLDLVNSPQKLVLAHRSRARSFCKMARASTMVCLDDGLLEQQDAYA